MVKGVARRVIVVRSPDPRFFEQAIFLMKEDSASLDGVTADQVLTEARQVAEGYWKRSAGAHKVISRIPGPVYALLGAAGTAVIWAATLVL